MKPIKFKEQNCTFAENQPEYFPLPSFKNDEGQVTTRWEFTWRERIKIFFGAKLNLSVLTFNKPLQPILMEVSKELEHRTDGSPCWCNTETIKHDNADIDRMK